MKRFLKCLACMFFLVFFVTSCGILSRLGIGGGEDEAGADNQQSGGGSEQEADSSQSLEHGISLEYSDKKVVVTLPHDDSQMWIKRGSYISQRFNEWGYETELCFAEGSAERQAEQINKAVSDEALGIVVAAVDSYSEEIRSAVENAAAKKIPVVALGRLIMDTEAVDVYVDFDPYLRGRINGQFLESRLNIGGESTIANIELFPGEKADGSAKYFYAGAMDVLMPHIDAGRANVLSGRRSFEQTALSGFSPQSSREAMSGILGNYGQGADIDAVLAADDGIALGVIEALENTGYGSAFPIITGAGCDIENMLKLIDGKQEMSLFCDERILADRVVDAVDKLSYGEFPAGADRTTFSNGKKVVPSILLEPVIVDAGNYRDVLIGGEYYSYTELHP